MHPKPKKGLDGLTLTALALFLFIGLSLVFDSTDKSGQVGSIQPAQASGPSTGGQGPPIPTPIPTSITLSLPGDPAVLAAPYDEYIITQGLHGFSYGHAAIDISGGKSAPILSPINGTVADNYIDQYGNSTLILENSKFQVTLLHGNYSARPGEKITVGQIVGTESNQGYTTDMSGRLCAGRDCGYHSHLNVFDKELNQNINPLEYFN